MKKTVKFSGTKDDEVAYFTAVFVPKDKERVDEIFGLVDSSVQLGEKDNEGIFTEDIGGTDRFSRIEKCNDRIILRIKYRHESSCGSFDDDIKDAKRDANSIVEQIEALISVFEED